MSDLALIQNSEDLIDSYKRLVVAAINNDKPTYQKVSANLDRLALEVETTRPKTMRGIRAKAQVALVLWGGVEDDLSSEDKKTALARSLIRDLAFKPARSKAQPSRPVLTVIEGGLKASG